MTGHLFPGAQVGRDYSALRRVAYDEGGELVDGWAHTGTMTSGDARGLQWTRLSRQTRRIGDDIRGVIRSWTP